MAGNRKHDSLKCVIMENFEQQMFQRFVMTIWILENLKKIKYKITMSLGMYDLWELHF